MTKQDYSIDFLKICMQATLNLLGKSQHPIELVGSMFDEVAKMPKILEINSQSLITGVYLHKMFLSYLFGDYGLCISYINLIFTMRYLATFF